VHVVNTRILGVWAEYAHVYVVHTFDSFDHVLVSPSE
jgi:hypothetical protein